MKKYKSIEKYLKKINKNIDINDKEEVEFWYKLINENLSPSELKKLLPNAIIIED